MFNDLYITKGFSMGRCVVPEAPAGDSEYDWIALRNSCQVSRASWVRDNVNSPAGQAYPLLPATKAAVGGLGTRHKTGREPFGRVAEQEPT